MSVRVLKRMALSSIRMAGYDLVKLPKEVPQSGDVDPAAEPSASVAPPPEPVVAPPEQPATVEPPQPEEVAAQNEPAPVQVPVVINKELPPHLLERELYESLYGADVFERRPFLNVGSGGFYHPAWLNMDFHTKNYDLQFQMVIDLEVDLSQMQPWSIPDNSLEAVYCSHTVEHLRDHHDRHIFHEAFRVLKPGGFFRITTPDIELYYNAYMRGDRHFFPSYAPWYVDEPNEQMFLREFATQISTACNDPIDVKKVSTEEIRELFHTRPMEEALDELSSRVDYENWYKIAPGNHVNWWSYDKAFRFLKEAGFKTMYRSGYAQSACPPMRRIPLFDTSVPELSMYVEAVKS